MHDNESVPLKMYFGNGCLCCLMHDLLTQVKLYEVKICEYMCCELAGLPGCSFECINYCNIPMNLLSSCRTK